MAGSSSTDATAKGYAALHQVGLANLANIPVSKLSGGERQRVAVARAIAAQSTLILADEPTASLDPQSREQVVLALKQASESGSLVLIATHDSWVAEQCDVSIRIHEGHLLG
jgi:ABC-type lipoprotein export system ATPase subunit